MTTWWKCLPLILIIFFSSSFLSPIYAHSGGTAADGCHYCRTNCDLYGVDWNVRHCHGGSTYTPPAPVCNKPGSVSNLTYVVSPKDDSCNSYGVDVEWNGASSASGYSISLNDYSTGNPGPLPDVYTSSTMFYGISPGTHYIHVRGTNSCGAGSISNYKVNVERESPELSVNRTLSVDKVDIKWEYTCGDSAYYEIDGVRVILSGTSGSFSIPRDTEKQVVVTAMGGGIAANESVTSPAIVAKAPPPESEPIVEEAVVEEPEVLGESDAVTEVEYEELSAEDAVISLGALGLFVVVPIASIVSYKLKKKEQVLTNQAANAK